ncbi:MAG: hypothetical protein HKN76_20955 [Saprospiraceae bacterium]|nr:hypothetical protein [Saprospiraceae bacterium]
MPNNPKYRYLTSKELLDLKEHFINYLASQGITADLWQKYQRANDPQIDQHLAAFSDLILESVYSSCELLESISKNTWLFYSFDGGTIYMRGLILESEGDTDLRELAKEDFSNWNDKVGQGRIKLIKAEKPMDKPKAREVHKLITQGSFISRNRSMYERLLQMYD